MEYAEQKFTNLAIFLATDALILPSFSEYELATTPHFTPPSVANAVTTAGA